MKKIFFLIAILISSSIAIAQSGDVPEKKSQKAFGKIDFLSIDIPETNIVDEKKYGIYGYPLQFNVK